MVSPKLGTPLEYTSMTEAVYQRVRLWIVSGELKPGARISIRSLADLLGTSATPVREALKRLQADGLVIASSRRELAVTQLDPVQVHDVFEIRLRLERLGNEWAIAKIDDEALRVLRGLAEAMEELNIDPDTWREHNRDFHRAFYALSNSDYLLDLIESAWDKTEPYLAIYVKSVFNFEEANAQHRALLRHMENGDLDALQKELEAHVRYTEATVAQAVAGISSSTPMASTPGREVALFDAAQARRPDTNVEVEHV